MSYEVEQLRKEGGMGGGRGWAPTKGKKIVRITFNFTLDGIHHYVSPKSG